jgi:hypothetical protein
MLGLEPHGEHLVVDPALTRSISWLELLDIPGRWGRVDAFARGRVAVDGRRGRRTQQGTGARRRKTQAQRGRRA